MHSRSGLVCALVLTAACASPHRRAATVATVAIKAMATPPATTAPAPVVAAATVVAQPAGFTAAVRAVAVGELRYSWHPGCPVAPSNLRALTVRYRTFSGSTGTGTLIVHRDVVAEMTTVFAELYRRGFPIRSIRPIDAFRGSDDASAAADNTSAFNCRLAVAPGSRSWSQHAYGRAVDVNDVENPYFEGGRVIPPAGRRYADRSNVRPGMAVRGGVIVTAFARAGWGWGGRWSSPDYQHFSANGR